jgi:hypothetical protein
MCSFRYDLKPIFVCVPSQNGLFFDPPQRQSIAVCTRATTRPARVTEIAAHLERPVGLQIDRQRAVAHCEHVGLAGGA